MFSNAKNAVYFTKIKKFLHAQKNIKDLQDAIVNAPFIDKLRAVQLDLGIVVLLLVDEVTGLINRVALSDTELAKGAVSVSAKSFYDINIPLDDKNNCIAEAIRTVNFTQTHDWKYLFTPVLTAAEARMNQAGAAIGCSVVHPIAVSNKRGALIFSFFQPPEHINEKHYLFASRYAKAVTNVLGATTPWL